MSINESLYIGVSGLQAHGDAISIVGDNIANASTVGFKRERANFQDVLGGELGAQRMGGGVFLGNAQTMYDQGALQQTGNPLDLALRGNGFFVVNGSHDGVTSSYYTRAGQFSLDNKGFVVNQQGLKLQGYTIDPTGTKGTAPGDLPLGARTSPAVATTAAKAAVQLNSNDPTIAVTPFDAANGATYSYQTSESVYDSLGNQHTVNMFYVNNGGGNWDYHATVDGGEVGGTAGTQQEISSGTLSFDTNGQLTAQTQAPGAVTFTGASPQTLALTFDGSTQYAQDATIPGASISTDINGRAAGSLTDITITDNGTVQGLFDNGERVDIAQIAVANFANQSGLKRSGDSLMAATTESGQALVDGAGVGGRAAISQGALEASNVDLGTELVTLIAYQRAFQANAKTVTTSDEMLTDIVNLKR